MTTTGELFLYSFIATLMSICLHHLSFRCMTNKYQTSYSDFSTEETIYLSIWTIVGFIAGILICSGVINLISMVGLNFIGAPLIIFSMFGLYAKGSYLISGFESSIRFIKNIKPKKKVLSIAELDQIMTELKNYKVPELVPTKEN